MTTYAGLILDFGGVVTTDFYGALDAFSVRAGLGEHAFVRVLREDPEGRQALAAVECGELPQREFERAADGMSYPRAKVVAWESQPHPFGMIR